MEKVEDADLIGGGTVYDKNSTPSDVVQILSGEQKLEKAKQALLVLRRAIQALDRELLQELKNLKITTKEQFSDILERGYNEEYYKNDKKNTIIGILIERFEKVEKVGEIKAENNIAIYQKVVWEEKIMKLKKLANEQGLDENFIEDILNMIHKKAQVLEKPQ